MKARIILIIAIFCTFAGKAWCETITKTYCFGGSRSGNNTFQGYFYEEGKPGARYTCFPSPSPWTFESTASIHATLPDGITINFASSNNRIAVDEDRALNVQGDVTVTVGGGTNNYYIWQVVLYNDNGSMAFNETNWGANVESTHTFSKAINAGFFNKLVITYSDIDIYLIDESSTTISGVDEEYLYAGSSIMPGPEVECNGRELIRSTHYNCIYKNCVSPGTATLTIEGLSPFHGEVSRDYTIVDPALLPVEWTAGSTVEVTEDYTASSSINVTGTGNVNLVIADGVTLTAQRGITIADGATLTVEGPGSLTVTNDRKGCVGITGSLIVNGGNTHIQGYDGIKGGAGRAGGQGGAGITGSLTVNGGRIHIKGGKGGTGGKGDNGDYGLVNRNGGDGGDGGDGITGSLTVNGGSIHVQGGNGGNGGNDDYNGGDGGDGGDGISNSLVVNGGTVYVSVGKGGIKGIGIGGGGVKSGSSGKIGTVTCTVVGYVIQESADENIWYNLSSGSTSNRRYVRVLESNTISLSAQQANFAGQTHYWTTFYHSSNNYDLPSGARAFYMGSDHALYLIGDGSVIPADCAVVIMAESASLEITCPSNSAPSVTGNILRGTSSAIQAPSGAHVMSQVGNTFGFFGYSGEIPAGKAYYVE